MHTSPLTLGFADIARDALSRVGGKGLNLAVLARAGINVPPGFCVTTSAFDRFIAALPDADTCFAALEALDGRSVDDARAASAAMRQALDTVPVPDDVARAVTAAWQELGEAGPLAVRSSATAEDLPGASFAGQQDTFLNVHGERALLDAMRRCWISLFTDRAVLYRARGRFGHRSVKLAVVVQRMVDPSVSGILFTADPITGHRQIASIDAGFGLGEALVSGQISPDLYKVDRRTGGVTLARAGDKAIAIRPAPGGGTRREDQSESQRNVRALSDDQVRELVDVGARIESLYDGEPQDIEWCIADGALYIVQTRPITSLFPIPRTSTDGLHVLLSFGHLQMMTNAMPRLALEVWQLFFPAGKATPTELSQSMLRAGGRLYIDVTSVLRVPRLRRSLLRLLSTVYEALGHAIATLANLPDFRRARGSAFAVLRGVLKVVGPVAIRVPGAVFVQSPTAGAATFDRALDAIPRDAARRIHDAATPSGRLRQCTVELGSLFARVRRHLPRVMAGFIALGLLRRAARGSWADGVRDDVDLLMRGLPGNVTTEMDLEVGDLTDRLRPYPDLVTLLQEQSWPDARRRLAASSPDLAAALDDFLARYGARGSSEIDISQPRWRDDPSLLLRVMIGGLSAAEAGAHRKQHQRLSTAAEAAATRLVTAAGVGLWGPMRRRWVRRLVRVARAGMGLREHPKFIIVQLLAVVREQVLAAAEILVARGQLEHAHDVWHLGFDELSAALDDPSRPLTELVARRVAEFQRDQTRKPPIAITSDGEIPAEGINRTDVPRGALAGTPASAGTVEGIARVVTDPRNEVLQAGEILVAPFTDPGWTPLFIHAAGVVTEVGGMMTHGAVVAREYGIPAVVSVASAVERIKTGQRLRVDGTRGYVEILDD